MKSFLLLISTLAIALSIAELCLRTFAPIYTVGIQNSYEYDEQLGVRLRKSVHLFRRTDHLEEIRTNKFGVADFRDDYTDYPTLAFAIGDSYTQGTGLPADESYPAQLDLMLNLDTTDLFMKRIAVVNLGLGSYGGEQSLIALKRFSTIIGKPSYCLYLGSENDFDDELRFKSGSRHRQLVRGNPHYKGLAEELDWIGSLQIALRARLAYANWQLGRLQQGSARARFPVDTIPKPGAAKGAKSTAELEWPVISRIVDTCKSLGSQIILAWVPPGNMLSYDWLKSKAAAEGLRFNDWYPGVASTRSALPSLPTDNPHSGDHYRGWVAGMIARGFKREMNLAPQ